MFSLTLARFAYLPTVTLGKLMLPGLSMYTLERPWRPNPAGPGGMPRESCVPDGSYMLTPYSSDKFQDVYQLTGAGTGVYAQPGDMPAGQKFGRSLILIHAGNVVEDVVGCVAVGLGLGQPPQAPKCGYWLLDSRAALGKLREALRNNSVSLTIRPSRGTSED